MALIGEMKYLQIGSNTYEIPTSELPIASSSTLGGIKVGNNLSIDSSTGVLSASFTETDPVFSASAAAGISSTDITNWNNKVSDDHKWNDVALTKSNISGYSGYVPYLSTTNATTAQLRAMSDSPSSGSIAVYNNGNYLISTTPTSGDSSTKVATTAFVAGAVSGISVPTASSTTPAMDGTAATGSETTFARGDHVHPTDTSRAAAVTVATQASISSTGLITFKNSGGTSLFTLQLPLYNGGVS